MWLFAFPSRTSSSPDSSRKWLLAFLCASHFCLTSKLLVSFLCLTAPFLHFCIFLWFRCRFFLHIFRYFLCCRRRAGGMSIVVDFGFCGVSFSARRFTSDQLCSASRRILRAYTIPSSVRTRCLSVRSLLPSHTPDFHLSASFVAGFPDSFPTSGRCASTDSSNSSNLIVFHCSVALM